MAGIALNHTYSYQSPSLVEEIEGSARIMLSTSGIGAEPDLFFRGTLASPRHTADLLLALVRVVQSRFYTPPAMLARILAMADPVVTCAENRLRFEGFSACCGVYGRVDLLPTAIDGALLAPGTTNVDFNPPMRAALSRLRDTEPAKLTVGAGAVELESRGERTFEKKVALPLRWLKGFTEVQSYQARMEPRFEISGTEARRFLHSLPRKGTGYLAAWIVRAGSGLRISTLGGPGAVRVGGLERLRILEDIVRHISTVRVYSEQDGGTTGWEADCGIARMFLVLSPESRRGFSGEGQALLALANSVPDSAVQRVQAALGWQPVVDVGGLSSICTMEPMIVRAALARLGARGLVGYDLSEGAYFHRELPFDLSRVEELQPRLLDARKLLAANGVKMAAQDADSVEAWVQGTDCEHHVRIAPDGSRCTCPWYSKHSGDRGPCKHILAVQLVIGDADDA